MAFRDLLKGVGGGSKELLDPPAEPQEEEIKEVWTVKTRDKGGHFFTIGSIVIYPNGRGSLRLFQSPDTKFSISRK